MIRVDRISVQNYKNIEVNDLSLTNFNVIVGPNNSGKSNFMQIFSFLNHIINGSQDLIKSEFEIGSFETYKRIVPHNNQRKFLPISVSIDYSDSKKSIAFNYSITISGSDNLIRRNMFIQGEQMSYKYVNKTGPVTRIFSREKESVDYGPVIKNKAQIEVVPTYISVISMLKIIKQTQSFPDEITYSLDALDSILKTETIYFSSNELGKPYRRIEYYGSRTVSINFQEEIYKLAKENPKKFDFLKETLREILKIDDVYVAEMAIPKDSPQPKIKSSFIIRFNHCGSFKSIFELSDGTRMLVALVIRLITLEQDFFLIEEPENSLHPKALVDLVSFIRGFENEKQFIIASHSISIINKIKPEDVIIAKCDNHGKSILQRVPNLRELRKRLNQGYIVFSDALFFEDDNSEDEM